MQHVFAISLIATLALSQHASASAMDDKKLITSAAFSNANVESMRRQISEAYVDVYADLLRDKSVRVVDRTKFAQLLPDALIDQWLGAMKTRFLQQCLDELSDQEITGLARLLRQETGAPPDPTENANSAASQSFAASLKILACSVQTQLVIIQELRKTAKGELQGDYSQLADILETNGIASFPNRIVKNSILAELRKSVR